MSTVVNDRDAILLAAATRIVNPKNADILLQQSAPAFHVNAAGAADVASITVSATLVGLEGAVSWSVQGATLTNVTDREATVTYANMQGSTAIVSASIMSSGERFAKSVVLATIQDGAPGSSAKTVKLTPSEQVFKISKTGTNSPASITLTATGQNTAGTPSFTIPVGTATLTAGSSSAQKVLTFANMATDQVTIEVTLDGQKDRVTIYKVREGQDGQPGVDAVVGLLTNETVTLPAGSNGVVSSFSGAACTMKVYKGAADDSANWTYGFAPASTANSLSYTTSGATLTVTGMAAGVDSAYVDITATKTGAAAVTKRFTVTKSKAGASVTGARGAGQHYVVGSAWSDVAAQAACPGGPVVNDQVTISNGTVTYTKRWDGAAWNVPGAYLSDELFVEKGIRASKIDTNGLVVRAPDGTVLLDMGGLRSGYEAPGTKNSDLDPKFASVGAAYLRWDFNGSVEGWTPGLADLSADAEGMIWTPTGMNASINRGFSTAERFKGSDYQKVCARVKRISGTGTWEGRLYHSTLNGHGTSVSYFARHAAPANLDDWTILEWDMSKLEQGGTDWLDSTITALRIDLISDFTTAPATSFKFDWIAIGKFNTGVSPAQVDAAAAAAAELARVTAQAYADGKVSSEEARAIADATAKAEAARVAATVTTDAGTGTTTFGQRERNDAPSEYPVGISRQFKRATSIGLTGNNGIDTNVFCTLETIKQFRDATGGGVYQYAYWGIKTFRRSAPSGTGAATTWTTWVQDLDRNVYTGDLDASKGAPVGTMVGGTDAGLVASRAVNGQSAYDAVNHATTGLAQRLSKNVDDVLNAKLVMAAKGAIQLSDDANNTTTVAPTGMVSTKAGKVNYSQSVTGAVVMREATVLGENDELILTTAKPLAQQVASNPNLAPNCMGFTGYGSAASVRSGDPRFGDGQYMVLNPTTGNTYVGLESPPLDIPAGAMYTVSFDAYCTGASRVLNSDVVGGGVDSTGISVTVTTTMTRYKYTEQMPSGANVTLALVRFFTVASGGSTIVISNVKVELGTVVTPWCDSVITKSNAKNRVFIPNLEALVAFLGSVEIGPGGNLRQGMSAFNTGKGVFLGDRNGVPVFSVGDPQGTGAGVYWDGTNFVIAEAKQVTRFNVTLPSVDITQQQGGTTYRDYGNLVPVFASGVPPYRLVWALNPGTDNLLLTINPDGQSVNVRARGANGQLITGSVSLTAYDGNNAIANAYSPISIGFGSNPVPL